MKMKLPLATSDLLLLRGAAIVFFVLTALSIAIVAGSNAFESSSTQSLQLARAGYEQVTTSVTQIAQEEETIIRYIDRYRQLARDGIIESEDRLALLEQLTGIREQFQLYPMQVFIEEQIAHMLPYPPEDPLPGEPVSLQQSAINVMLPLLHEGDLLRAMDSVLQLPALLQPVDCTVELDSSAALNGTSQLKENVTALCRLHWYTFNLEPAIAVDGEF